MAHRMTDADYARIFERAFQPVAVGERLTEPSDRPRGLDRGQVEASTRALYGLGIGEARGILREALGLPFWVLASDGLDWGRCAPRAGVAGVDPREALFGIGREQSDGSVDALDEPPAQCRARVSALQEREARGELELEQARERAEEEAESQEGILTAIEDAELAFA